MANAFDTGNDYRKVSFPITSISAWTWMGWFFPTNTRTFNGLVGVGDSSNFLALIYRGDINALNVYNGITLVNGATSISLNTWNWVGFVVSGVGAGGINAYLNGDSTPDATHAGNVLVTVKDLYLGTDPGNDFNIGRIGNNYFYDAVLTATEIAQQRWRVVPVRTSNLSFWSPFIKVETTDYSGSGNTLTQTGTPTIADGPPVAWSGSKRPQKFAAGGAVLPPPTMQPVNQGPILISARKQVTGY